MIKWIFEPFSPCRQTSHLVVGVDAFQGVIADEIDIAVNVQAVPASIPDDKLPPAK